MFILKRIFNSKKLKCEIVSRFKYSYSFEPSSESLSPLTIGKLIEERAIDSPNLTACISVHQNISKTYKELNYDANKLALGLKNIGCKKGDRIGIWAPNCYEWLLTQYATAKIGAIMVNVNPAYRSNELEYCLNLVECHTLICSQKFRTSNYCEILENISPNLLTNAKGSKINCEKIPTLRNLIMINNDEEIAPNNITRFNDLVSNTSGHINVESSAEFDDPINIQFTSGTTGHPKGATLTHHNIIHNAYFVGKRALEGLDLSQLRVCVPNPLYHCFGSVLGSILVALNRGTLVLPAPIYNPIETLKAIHNFKCNLVYGTPTMYVDILNSDLKKFDTQSLQRGLMSGAPCPVPLLESVQTQIPSCKHILIPYGSTECSPVVSITSIRDSKKHQMETVGRPIDHLEIKIIDPKSGSIKAIGEPGEVCIRGHCTFIGYWNQFEQTEEVLDKNRWYHTGDIGLMDQNGFISINGRIKDMIIRGGENIYPKEIEDFLMSHPLIADAHIVGIPDKRLGEELVAYIKLKTNSSLNSNTLKEFCRGKISHFKIPENIEFVEEFPRTVTGKVQKFKLREIAKNVFKQS